TAEVLAIHRPVAAAAAVATELATFAVATELTPFASATEFPIFAPAAELTVPAAELAAEIAPPAVPPQRAAPAKTAAPLEAPPVPPWAGPPFMGQAVASATPDVWDIVAEAEARGAGPHPARYPHGRIGRASQRHAPRRHNCGHQSQSQPAHAFSPWASC